MWELEVPATIAASITTVLKKTLRKSNISSLTYTRKDLNRVLIIRAHELKVRRLQDSTSLYQDKDDSKRDA